MNSPTGVRDSQEDVLRILELSKSPPTLIPCCCRDLPGRIYLLSVSLSHHGAQVRSAPLQDLQTQS